MTDESLQDQAGSDERSSPHGRRVYVGFVLLMMFVAAVFAMKSSWQRHVPVKRIAVEGIGILGRDEVVRLMNVPPTVPMAEVDLSLLQRNLLTNSFVERVVIQRDAPAFLRVSVTERKPAAILNAGRLYFLASDGTVLPYIATTEVYDIPVISGIDSLTGLAPGKRLVHAEVNEALELIALSRAAGRTVFNVLSEIRLRKGKDIVAYTFDEGIPVIFGRGDAVRKVAKFEAFWQQVMMDHTAADIRYIDLRYEDQVVVSRKNS